MAGDCIQSNVDCFIPVFGQLADIFGRYTSLQLAVVMSLIGSIICATAPSWPALLLGRAFQGIGAAGIDNVTMIILADQASLKEHAVNVSIFQLLNGIGYSESIHLFLFRMFLDRYAGI